MKKRFVLPVALGAVITLGALVPGAVPAADQAAPYAGAPGRVWPDESIYFLMTDRFNNGDKSNDGMANPADPKNWHGGDIQGVIDKLDYIKSMGFTAIWITPHVVNAGHDYHGYGAIDFYNVDPHFGTTAKLKELVEKAHARGLKVLFDMVVNHTGPQSPLVSQHPDWFHPKKDITNWNDDKQVQEGWIFGLPDFDQSKPEVRQYILDYSKFWIDQTGVDGFRLDTVRHVAPEFFTWYNQELQKIKPGFWLIGEVFDSSVIKVDRYQEAGVTAMLDFPIDDAARKTFAHDASMSSLASVVANEGKSMQDPYQMGAFLDNHDMKRFVSEARDNQVERLKLGLTFLFTQRSIPIMYYGTEIAMPGGDDPDNRHDFPWGHETNTDVRDLVTKLNKLRQEHPALRRGTVENLLADQTTYAYARVDGADKVLVVLNNNGKDPFQGAVDVSAAGLADGTALVDQISGRQVTVSGGKVTADVGARTGAIYVAMPAAQGTVGIAAVLAGMAVAIGGFAWRRQRASK